MSKIRIITGEEGKNLLDMGSKFVIGENEYYYIPFWFKLLKDEKKYTYLIYSLDQLPEELKNEIKKTRL